MLRTYVYIISILLLLNCRLTNLHAQDTITVPLKIKVGVEVSGPAIYYSNKNILNAEAYISLDLNERQTLILIKEVLSGQVWISIFLSLINRRVSIGQESV
jgi:hypothetical protein